MLGGVPGPSNRRRGVSEGRTSPMTSRRAGRFLPHRRQRIHQVRQALSSPAIRRRNRAPLRPADAERSTATARRRPGTERPGDPPHCGRCTTSVAAAQRLRLPRQSSVTAVISGGVAEGPLEAREVAGREHVAIQVVPADAHYRAARRCSRPNHTARKPASEGNGPTPGRRAPSTAASRAGSGCGAWWCPTRESGPPGIPPGFRPRAPPGRLAGSGSTQPRPPGRRARPELAQIRVALADTPPRSGACRSVRKRILTQRAATVILGWAGALPG